MPASYVDDSAAVDGCWPPRVELRQFDPSRPRSAYDTECLVDSWHALQRSSGDAALLPASDRNVFAFSDSCLYMATVHDLDFPEKELTRREREKQMEEEERMVEKERLRKAREDLQINRQLHVAPDGAGVGSGSVAGARANSSSAQDYDMTDPFEHDDQEISSSSAHNTAQTTSATWLNDNTAADVCASSLKAEETAASHTITPYTMSTAIPSAYDIDLNAPFSFPEAQVPDQYTDTSSKSTSGRPESDLIGIAYLAPTSVSASPACEVSLGLALLPHARGKGFGTETARRLLALAFDDLAFHRVSANVLGPSPSPLPSAATPETGGGSAESGNNAGVAERLRMSGTEAETEAALRMFVALGFTLEGTRRRAVPESDDNGAWRDAHSLAMLDTEWFALQRRERASSVVKGKQRKGKGRSSAEMSDEDEGKCSGKNGWAVGRRTRWDEMLARHQREQEALAGAESRLKRSASTETLRPGAEIDIDMAADGATSVSASTAASEAGGEASVLAERTSISNTASNPFLDDVRARSGARSRFHRFSDEESGESEAEYGEETASSRVARYLRAHPQPGPPPSELGSVSDFESCVDDQDFLVPARGIESEPLLGVADSSGPSNSSPSLDASPAQARKKRRLLDDLASTTGPDAPASSPPPTSSSGSGAGVDSTSARSPASTFLPRARANTHITNFSDAGMESESDAETASTSAWDVLSGGARSPSPSPSLSSGTGSLSLQSASESDGE